MRRNIVLGQSIYSMFIQKDTTRTKKKMVLPRSPPTIVMYSDPDNCCLNSCMAANDVSAMEKDRMLEVPLETAVK